MVIALMVEDGIADHNDPGASFATLGTLTCLCHDEGSVMDPEKQAVALRIRRPT